MFTSIKDRADHVEQRYRNENNGTGIRDYAIEYPLVFPNDGLVHIWVNKGYNIKLFVKSLTASLLYDALSVFVYRIMSAQIRLIRVQSYNFPFIGNR